MRAGVNVVRRWGVWAACLVSLMVGSALVWRVLTPDSLQVVMTGELLALVGLFVLPVMAAWSFLAQRRGGAADGQPARTREHGPALRLEDVGEHHRRRVVRGCARRVVEEEDA